MALPRLIPALADLTQDIAGPLPVDLLREWVTGHQNVDKATSLLRPFVIRGTVVATDSSGLSALTEERDLLDVLTIVSQPKEIVHAMGTAVGGRAIGMWVADNTEMHYPDGVPLDSVVGAMLEAQARVAAEAQIRIGMCVHEGEFYEIGGGLYGHDADTVEYLAEVFAAPGEILVTHPSADRLVNRAGALARRRELDVVHSLGVSSLTNASQPAARAGIRTDGSPYPHPFPEDFFQSLLRLRASDAPAEMRAEIYRTLIHNRTIVFIARERETLELGSITALLDDLATNVVMEAVLTRSAAVANNIASLGGGLAILSYEHTQQAVEAALAIRDTFVEAGLPVKIGIDAGPVLLFTNPRGRSGISGDAVNIASKISEDFGVVNMVSVTSRAASAVRGLSGGVPFQGKVSRVFVSGVRW